MTSVKARQFVPSPAAHGVYNELYAIYRELHDQFGGVAAPATLGSVMKRLLALQGSVRLG